jgi:hypothetical protein
MRKSGKTVTNLMADMNNCFPRLTTLRQRFKLSHPKMG